MPEITKILPLEPFYTHQETFTNDVRHSANTRRIYQTTLHQYQGFLKENNLQESSFAVRSFLDHIRENLAASTYNVRRQSLKQYLCAKYRETNQIQGIHDLFKNIRPIRLEKSIRQNQFYTVDEIHHIANALSERMGTIFLALFYTGFRIGELINVKLKDITVETVVTLKTQGKRSKQIIAHIPHNLYLRIRQIFVNTTQRYLLETRNKRPYSRNQITNELKAQGRRIGFKLNSHVARHSFAMYQKSRGLTPDEIAAALHHSSPLTTLEYYFHSKPTPDQLGLK